MKKINSTFYCIQPLYLKEDSLLKLFQANFDGSKLKKNINSIFITNKQKKLEWQKTLNNLYGLYDSFILLDVNHNICNLLIDGEMPKNIIFKYISLDESYSHILFDYRLMQFVVVHKLSFYFPIDLLENSFLKEYKLTQTNLYSIIRKLLVPSLDQSSSHFLTKYYKDITKDIKIFIESYLNLKIPLTHIDVIKDTGNITHIIILEKNNIESYKYKLLSKEFFNLHSHAERITGNILPFELSTNHKPVFSDDGNIDYKHFNKELYFFGGRFHTIILQNTKNKYRYIPLQFHIQYLWFYLSKEINPLLEKFHDKVTNNNVNLKGINQLIYNTHTLVHKVEILDLFNQKFKTAIEIDKNLYSLIEHKWNIENMLKSSNKYTSSFKEYLNFLYNNKLSKINKKQNNILLFITLLQIITLISVWNDYLSLLDINSPKIINNLSIFGNIKDLILFNKFLPVMLIMSIFIVLFFYKRK